MRAVAVAVDDTITEAVTVPAWLSRSVRVNCDCCRFPIEGNDLTSALRLKSGEVMVIHSQCLPRLTAE